jgi:hypothetical protein
MDILTFWLVLSIGAAMGWFIGVLMTGTKIQDLEEENFNLKLRINVLEDEVASKKVSNRKRVKN